MKKTSLMILFTMTFAGAFEVSKSMNKPYSENAIIDLDAIRNLSAHVASYAKSAELNEVNNTVPEIEKNVIESVDLELEKEIKSQKKVTMKKKNNLKKIFTDEVKVQNSALVHSSSKEDLSRYEIITKDTIELTKFPNEKLTMAESGPIEPQVIENSDKDEMVFFDYKKEKIEEHKNAHDFFKAPLSQTVKEAISREIETFNKNKIGTSLSLNTHKKIESKESNSDVVEDQIVYDYSSVLKKDKEKEKEMHFTESSSSLVKINIGLIDVNLNTNTHSPVKGFEFIPDYDRQDISHDNHEGLIHLEYSVTEKENLLTGVISRQGAIPTRIEFPLIDHDQMIPSFSEESFEDMSIQNSLLVKLGSELQDVDIDHQYEKKIFLDENLKKSDSKKDYVLFMGVQSGNILIKYLMSTQTSQKIIYLGEGELFYDESIFNASKRESFELFTRSLMAKGEVAMNIRPENISYFNTSIHPKHNTLTSYESKIPAAAVGSRKYFEIKKGDDSIFFGMQSKSKIEIPENDFLGKVLEFHHVSTLRERCLVTVNLDKDIESINVSGKNNSGEMFVETSFLNKEGMLALETGDSTDKVFLLGEGEGQIGLKLNYLDGSNDYLKTFCSPNTILVEQL